MSLLHHFVVSKYLSLLLLLFLLSGLLLQSALVLKLCNSGSSLLNLLHLHRTLHFVFFIDFGYNVIYHLVIPRGLLQQPFLLLLSFEHLLLQHFFLGSKHPTPTHLFLPLALNIKLSIMIHLYFDGLLPVMLKLL